MTSIYPEECPGCGRELSSKQRYVHRRDGCPPADAMNSKKSEVKTE